MPRSSSEKIEDIVLDVIRKDFLEDFMEIYGLTISIAEVHPEQANNEIRNALTHLARALCNADKTDAAQNIRDARKHIERGKRDSLKLAIVTKREQIASSVLRIELTEGAMPKALKQRFKAIEKKRKKAFCDETKGDSVSPILEEVLADALDLEDQITDTFNDPGTIMDRKNRFFLKSKSIILKVSFAIVCSLAAAYIFAYLVPAGTTVGDATRDVVSAIFSPIFPDQFSSK